MPSPYILKTSPLDRNRLQKICKRVIDEANEDRKFALETHRFFRQMLDENPQDASAKNLMVDCLKLAQTSKGSILKVVDLLIKLESAKSKGSDKAEIDTLYSQLDNLTD
ncbi:MAG TPA: hypothetical protein DCS66_25720 [Flavobacteriaceae bacterium]|nr:hypothetical protein [Flavobacteriaceae bacterium]|tara:strand:+ start:174 stop:500 length:327 start_codon:yes stop_codon:yes gene_type:complete